MFAPRIVLGLFNGDFDVPLGERALRRYLEAHIETMVDYLGEHPSTPLLYHSGVRYKRQDMDGGQEDWHDIPSAIEAEKTDCKVLAAWRIAELRIRGVAAKLHILWNKIRTKKGEVYLFHVQVMWPDNVIEDPSRVLGMESPF